ncbi:MAG TPA: response regulator transcription factor [Leptospiraceae bacterium]|nr:response regulator transcription factor [Leptospiraceae bacterium]HMW05511.1 response regulator transcription factor [Leptospiraceae bacterium]HMX32462.1 response regulator transcription factor [Leptospiraceae bacterium]HMY31021.1 response regulator transcription factor [Leptospiraceae bacterium]HMZ65055.1 response regulator transcription factor [Leptospiraceae bacterium]
MLEQLKIILIEDNVKLRKALKQGLEETKKVSVLYDCDNGAAALEFCRSHEVDVLLFDVQIIGPNGIESAITIRKEFPRKPVVFYSIQDDDSYFRDFRRSGILSHYAYVKKSNYLLPSMILPLLKDAYSGRSFIDPEIETRVAEVKYSDENSPLALLEPNEREVAKLISVGLSNEQIALKLGVKDKRTISRINGQIYTVWGLADNATDEKVARTRASLIVRENKLLTWTEKGKIFYLNERGEEVNWDQY